jgi:hypothetical protein
MATALKLYTKDQNLNAISKTVGNVNPVATDYVLKHFSEQLVSLSANTLQKIERVDTKDITNADTDTSTVNWVLRSTSDIFSADSEKYAAAAAGLTNGMMYIGINENGGANRTVPIDIDANFKALKGVVELGKLISSKLVQAINGEIIPLATVTGSDGQLAFSDFFSSRVNKVTVSATTQGIITSIWEGVVQPASTADYTVTFESNVITIQKK